MLALGASLAWGFSDFTGGFLSRRAAVVTVVLASQLAGLGGVAIAVAVAAGDPPGARQLAWAAGAGVAGVAGIGALYRGMAIGAMSVVAPLSAVAAVIPAAADVAAGRPLGALRGAGIVLALAGVALTAYHPGAARGLAAGVPLALVAMLGFGGFFVALDRAATDGFWWPALVARAVSVAAVALVALGLRSPPRVPARLLPAIVAVGLLDVGANVLFAAATTKGLVSVVSVLVSLYPVVVVVLARLVLGERVTPLQSGGAAVALAGAAMVSAG